MAEHGGQRGAISGTQFDDVDRSDDPQARVRYLDMVAKSTDYKRDSIRTLALGPGNRVLDIGCGAGDDVRLMAELVGPAGRAVGLDMSETMVAEARRRGTGGGQSAPIEFQQGDIYALPFPDGVFDATRADRVFQHLTEPLAALAEMQRVTRPGGVVSAIDPDWDTLVVDVPNRALFRKIFSHYLDTHAGRNSGSQLFGLFHRGELREVRVALTVFAAWTDYAAFNQLVNLSAAGNEAYAAGAITAAEHADWSDTLDELEATGPFFAAMGGVGVIGTKP